MSRRKAKSASKATASLSTNRTGIALAEDRAQEMVRDMELFPPTSTGSRAGPGVMRLLYAREGHRIGTVPLAGAHDPTPLFTDKLGERLAFERSGTRLYEALLSKLETTEWAPAREDVIEILQEEHRHFDLLRNCITQRGGDPTAMTPAADVAGVMSHGVQKIVTDPRTTLLQSLDAVLVAELVDNEGWAGLIELAGRTAADELVASFQEAADHEARHLELVRAWIRAGREQMRDE